MKLVLLLFFGNIVVICASELQRTIRSLIANSDALFEMYKEHKNAVSTGGSSSLQNLIEDILRQAEETPSANSPKHILTILTDDQGYADVGYHDSTFVTPTIDAIAHRGTKLTSFYVQNTCSPTRASLLTGRYLGQTGLQVTLIWEY